MIGIFIGILIGALVAAGTAWYFTRSSPFQPPAEDRPPPPARPVGGNLQPAPLPGKPGDTPVAKPEFDFYRLLPQGESAPGTPPAPRPEAAAPSGERLFLQAGAFENPAEADNLKARLALMGIESASQRADLPDRGAVHRVRVGPFASPEEMAPVRSRLAEAGINAAVVRVRPREN